MTERWFYPRAHRVYREFLEGLLLHPTRKNKTTNFDGLRKAPSVQLDLNIFSCGFAVKPLHCFWLPQILLSWTYFASRIWWVKGPLSEELFFLFVQDGDFQNWFSFLPELCVEIAIVLITFLLNLSSFCCNEHNLHSPSVCIVVFFLLPRDGERRGFVAKQNQVTLPALSRDATAATQMSGERWLSLCKHRNTSTARNFQEIGNAFQLARVTCGTCAGLAAQLSSYFSSPSLMGEGATLRQLAFFAQVKNTYTKNKADNMRSHYIRNNGAPWRAQYTRARSLCSHPQRKTPSSPLSKPSFPGLVQSRHRILQVLFPLHGFRAAARCT